MVAVEPVGTEVSEDDGRAWAEEDQKPKASVVHWAVRKIRA